MFTYECPRCGELLETDADPGTPETCPACGHPHKIPVPLSARIRRQVRQIKRQKARAERQEAATEPAAIAPAPDGEAPPEPPPVPQTSRPTTETQLAARRSSQASRYSSLHSYALLLMAFGYLSWIISGTGLVLWLVAPASESIGHIPIVADLISPLPVAALLGAGLVFVALGHLLLCLRDIAVNSSRIASELEARKKP